MLDVIQPSKTQILLKASSIFSSSREEFTVRDETGQLCIIVIDVTASKTVTRIIFG